MGSFKAELMQLLSSVEYKIENFDAWLLEMLTLIMKNELLLL
jgi:hypothetical protein